jgi:NAD(P)H dehydrogenase (quinone)
LIVVTGSTDHVGRLVADELVARGRQVRLLVRDAARAPEIAGAEVAVGNYGDAGSLAAALRPGDRVFMVSLHEGPERRVPLHRAFVAAARRARVAQIVYLSFVNASPKAIFLHAQSHAATEQMLRESGIPWTSIRNGMYADDIPGWFDADGVAREPGGEGRMSFSYRSELATAIAVTLTEQGHEGRTYNIVTPESVTMAELAEAAARVTGDPYRWEPADDDSWEVRWRTQGRIGWELEAGHSTYEALRRGELDVVTADYRRLTGEEPLTIPKIIERLADAMPLARS